MARGLELFRRQLGAATEAVTLLVPARDLSGKRLSASTGLALICHLLGETDPGRLIRDIRTTEDGGCQIRCESIVPLPLGGSPNLPESGRLNLADDLLRLREQGAPVAQSPSRLETLLYSPLAWLLDELGAKNRTWTPESLDVLTLGSLVGRILEVLFPKDLPVAEDAALSAATPAALADAIRAVAPWFAGPHWAAERAGLELEVLSTVLAWARFLHESGSVVIGNEVPLSGDKSGLLIAGRADTLLRLPDGRLLLIDHKRSRSRGRRDRMVKGWDLQVALYRAMLERPTHETELTGSAKPGKGIVTGYHTTLDATVLVESSGRGIPGTEVAAEDISFRALDALAARVAEVGSGRIELNAAGDLKRFERDCGIAAYALKDNSLVNAFLIPEALEEEPEDE